MTKNPYHRYFWLAALVSALLLPTLLSANNDKKIDASVMQDVSGNYVLVFANAECPADWQEKKGCVLQRKGNSGKIEWRLDDAAEGAGWKLTALYFGTLEKQPGVRNYYVGEKTRWRAGVPAFSQVLIAVSLATKSLLAQNFWSG